MIFMEEVQTSEKRVKEEGNAIIAVIVGFLLTFIAIIIIFGFNFGTNQIVIFILLIIAFYAIVLSFLFESKLVREIKHIITKTNERPPVEKETVKIVRKPIVYEMEKPVIREVMQIVDRPVFIKKEKLNIPKYDYLGSIETKNYHKKSCRLGKLIKKKYKILNNDPKYFIKRGFSPCKVCILKEKKV